MNRSYALLKVFDTPINLDFSQLEEKYLLAINHDFKKFVNNILLGNDKYFLPHFNINKVYNESTAFVTGISQVVRFKNQNFIGKIVFDRFIANEKIIDSWVNGVHSDPLFEYYQILPIGYLYDPVHTRILIGVGSSNAGKVYIDINEELISIYKEKVIRIADSIWEFIEGFEEVINEQLLLDYGSQNLYKNWNEDYWRVRTIDP